MKTINKSVELKLIFVLILICSGGCTKDTFSDDGYYSGSFSYNGEVKFDALIINGNNYEEVPSGGAMNQKFPCLVKGSYRIKGNKITFTTSVEPDCICDECLLKGEYVLVQSGNTIKFQREAVNGLQVYNLTLVTASR